MAEEIQDLSVKLSMDSTGFQEGISTINRQMAIARQEFRTASAQLGEFANSKDQLKAKADSLSKQLELQAQKVKILSKAYEESRVKSGENTKATDDLRIKLLQAQRQEAELNNQLKQVNEELKNQNKAFGNAGSGASTFSNILRNAFSVTLGMGFFDMIKTGFNAAKEAAFGFNSSLEQNRIAFTTLMGGAEKANEYIEGMMKYSSKTPFEFKDLAEGSKLLMAFGFEASKIPGMIEAIGNASSALGMSGSEGLQRIGLQLGQMNTLGKATYQDLKQLAQAGVPVWDILAEAIGKSTGEVQKMVSDGLLPAGETIDVLIAGMNDRFGGMMEAQSTSWQGLMSSIKDNISIALGISTETIFTSLKGHLETISDKLQEFNAVLKDEGLKAALETLIPEPVVDGLAALVNMFGWLIDHGELVIATTIGIGTAFATIKLARLISDAGGLVKVFKNLTGVFSLANLKIVAIGAVIAVLAGTAYLLYRNWEHVPPFFEAMWEGIKASFETGKNAVGVALRGLQVFVAESLNFTVGNVVDMVAKMLGIFAEIPLVGDSFAKAQEKVNAFSRGLDSFVKYSKDKLNEAIANTANSARKIIDSSEKMKQAGANMVVAIGEDLSGMANKAKESFKSLTSAGDEAIEGFDTTALGMEEAGANLVDAIGKGVESKSNKVKEVVEGIADEINTAVYLIDREIKKLLDDSSDLETYQDNLSRAMELTAQKVKLLESEFNRLSQAKNVNKNTLQQLIREIDNAKDAYDELGKKIVEVAEKIRDANIKTANDFVEQIKDALKRRYEEERDLREASLEAELKSLDNWKDESIKRINDVYEHKIKLIEDSSNAQIEALNAELRALEDYEKEKTRAEQDAEDLDKINRLKDAIEYEHNEYNKAQLKKELENAEKEFAKRKEKEKLEDKKQAIKDEIASIQEKARIEKEILQQQQNEELERINNLYAANKESLQAQLNDLKEFYRIRLQDAQLHAEAEQMIMKNNQEAIMDLLYQYTDHYKAVGQTFGDKMVEGFAPMIDEIHKMIDEVMKRISEARSMQLTVPKVNTSPASTGGYGSYPNSITNPDGSRDYIWPDGRRESITFNTTINSPIARTLSQEKRDWETTQRNMLFQAGLA